MHAELKLYRARQEQSFSLYGETKSKMNPKKRERSSPTGKTPKQDSKRLSSRVKSTSTAIKKSLTFTEVPPQQPIPQRLQTKEEAPNLWKEAEDLTLINFLVSKGFVDRWPSTRRIGFWEEASAFLAARKWTRPSTFDIDGIIIVLVFNSLATVLF